MSSLPSLAQAAEASERVLAGTFLLEPERFIDAGVSASDFGVAAIRLVVDATAALICKNGRADLTLVCEELRRRRKLPDAGGAAFVASLTEGIPRRVPIEPHVEHIRRGAMRRKLAAIAERLEAGCYDVADDPEALARRTLEQLGAVEAGANGSVDLVPLSAIEARPVAWLWEPYLALGTVAMLSGDPGCGKTFLSLAIAAALSLGRLPATDGKCELVSTVYMSHENEPSFVTRPRFDSLGGDASRLHLLGLNSQITLADTASLEGAIRATGARLLIVDPIQSYLGADVDAHRANETRPVMDGLAALAGRRNCCILLLRHLAKGSSGRAIHRGLGSVDLTGAVRTEMLAGSVPDDPQTRALVMLKSNLGRFGDSLAYTIDAKGFAWAGETNLRASDVLGADTGAEDGQQQKREVDEWLANRLAAGPRPLKERKDGTDPGLIEEAKDRGYTEAQLRRAGSRIGVVPRQPVGQKAGGWFWHLPSTRVQTDKRDDKRP